MTRTSDEPPRGNCGSPVALARSHHDRRVVIADGAHGAIGVDRGDSALGMVARDRHAPARYELGIELRDAFVAHGVHAVTRALGESERESKVRALVRDRALVGLEGWDHTRRRTAAEPEPGRVAKGIA